MKINIGCNARMRFDLAQCAPLAAVRYLCTENGLSGRRPNVGTRLMTARLHLSLAGSLAALVLAGLLSTASAQQGPGRGMGPGMMGPGMGPGQGMRMWRVDTDGDAMISADEAAAWQEEAFAAMDADADGELTKEEYLAVHFGPGGGAGPRAKVMAERKEARFAEADRNSDGKLTLEEFMAAGQARFARADRDSDGKVSVWEFRAARGW